MFSLSDLPDDILNLISIRLNGFDNCSLWMASDSILRQRLVNNVITDFDIKYTIPGRYLWPGNFLKKLSKLSRLSLVVDEDVYHLPIHNIELFPIPTLKSLKLSISNPQIFEETISSNHSTGPRKPSAKKYINLNHYYSNLEHLEIINWSGVHHLSIDFLHFLPRKLKSLSIPYSHLDLGNSADNLNSSMRKLPESLRALDIHFSCCTTPYLDLSKLPPNLTSLTTNACINDETYHMIPKSFKKIDLSANAYNIEKLSPYLPTGLESLEIMIDQHSSPHQMFRHLQNLQFLRVDSRKKIHWDDFLIKCPPKLQTFNCTYLDVTNFPANSQFLNDCLTKLELLGVVGITAEFISILPQSLTDFTLYQYHDDGFAFFSRLPRKLKSLDTDLIIVDNISLLPESLTNLKISSDFNEVHFDRLPPKLETLNLMQNLPKSVLKKLPVTLRELFFTSSEVVDDEIVGMLPRGLKLFLLDTPDTITDAGIADLPPSLEILILKKNTRITDDGIVSLPRTLVSLSLPLNPNFTDNCVKHLPPKLISLRLDRSTKITSESCKELPKYLAELYLSKCMDWSIETLIASKNELPQYIVNLHLGNTEANIRWKNLAIK